jgi:hypothetical protein
VAFETNSISTAVAYRPLIPTASRVADSPVPVSLSIVFH